MEGFEVFKIYTALKAHFLSNYDYVKSNGQTKVSVGAWNKRNDKYYFEKFGRLYKNDVEPMLISIFVQNPNIWVGDLVEIIGFSFRRSRLCARGVRVRA